MLRFVLASVLLASVAFAQVQTNDPFAQQRQSFGASGSLGLGDFGGINAGANLNLPTYGSGNNLLTTLIIGLGVISLMQLIATVAVPFFDKKDNETPQEAARRARMLDTVRDTVLGGIQAFAEKYNVQ